MARRMIVRAAGAAAIVIALTAAGQRGSGALVALDTMERGRWQIKQVDGGPERAMCLGNPTVLLQLRHGEAQCSHFVVENSPRVATIHYTCPGRGYGRTTISLVTPRVARIDTQGVIDGQPFAQELEGRKVGVCD